MPVIRGFFFDLDGTLVNTYQADFLAYRDAIAKVCGVTIKADQFAKTHGQEIKQKLESFKLKLTPSQIARISEYKKESYYTYMDKVEPLDVMINLLKHVSKTHITVLVTTAKKHNAQLVLEKYNITKLFTHTVFGDDVEHYKPHPESYQIALQKSGLAPDEVMTFEDSDSGVTAALAAGLAVIKVPRL